MMTEKRKNELLCNFVGWFIDHQTSDEGLFRDLHIKVGMTKEELYAFDIFLDEQFDEAERKHQEEIDETTDMITAEDIVEQAVYAANAPDCCADEQAENMFGFGMRGYIVESRFTDENGVEMINPIQYHIITPYDKYTSENEVASNHIVKDDMLKIIVNGQEVDELPTSPGTYDIVVDYSSIVGFLDNVSYQIQVFGFNGWFILVEE